MKPAKLGLLLILITAVALTYQQLSPHLSLDALKAHQAQIQELFLSRPFFTASSFMLIYVAATALSLPGAAVLTLAGGTVFGLAWGLVLVSISSTIGATLAFLASRFF